ncbi:ABC transporter substrate-binding protein [Candidatus Atribacteria bacterium HGW-Atribacteria-1]|nr:MAG: ABC transporter substrate-binding protein [Candidatus Atribacteria bacterium HGW-Atribacteria-1]
MKKFFLLLISLALIGSLLTLFALAESRGGTLSIGVDQEVVGLDPHIVTAFSSFRRLDLLYNTLVKLDYNLDIVPDLADSWEIPDSLTYIFHLKKGVKFHNGRELTADDVKFSLERILDPKTASPGRSYIIPISNIESIDQYTIRIELSSPLASFLDGLTSKNCAIVPKEEVEKYGNLQRNVVGTGPFKLEEWVPDNYMKLVKNPSYFEKEFPYLDAVIFRVIPEQTSLLAGIKSGSLDIATINEGSIILQAKKDPNLVVIQVPGLNLRTFGFNNTREPFNDVRVREAIALAIDRDEIVNAAEFGMAQPSGPLAASVKKWAKPLEELPFSKPNLKKARELLAEAGYPDGFSFNVVASSTYEGGLAVAQIIQSQLKKVGLRPELEVVEWGIYIDRWVKRDFDSMVELRGGSPEPDRFLYRSLHSTGGVNNWLFKDEEVDKLLDEGRKLIKFEDRKPIYDKIQVLLSEKVPVIFLYVPLDTKILSPNVKNFRQMGNGSIQYLSQTWLEK